MESRQERPPVADLVSGFPEVIPIADSDYVYAAIAEEMGLVGGALVVLAVIIFVIAGIRTSIEARDMFTKLCAAGLTAFVGIQALVNIGGITRALPMTGITLPFVSHGGFSLITSFAMLGMLMAFSHRNAYDARAVARIEREPEPSIDFGGSPMSTAMPANNVDVASVSDRGLSEKRPLNEDSFLADADRGIFVVADGVGGADAGEVASQTAVDVLNDAFRTKITDGEDVEDLMELAIQRANSSIHQMASENPRFSMMATTVVALHLDGHRATIGHVGDSRLYRLSPDGNLHRETEDHSIVEEEVRAGRMTPEQAANHPSKNVISRALGAEATVEADMKVIEVEDGSAFLLCTDGITRHLGDNELRELLTEWPNTERSVRGNEGALLSARR